MIIWFFCYWLTTIWTELYTDFFLTYLVVFMLISITLLWKLLLTHFTLNFGFSINHHIFISSTFTERWTHFIINLHFSTWCFRNSFLFLIFFIIDKLSQFRHLNQFWNFYSNFFWITVFMKFLYFLLFFNLFWFSS